MSIEWTWVFCNNNILIHLFHNSAVSGIQEFRSVRSMFLCYTYNFTFINDYQNTKNIAQMSGHISWSRRWAECLIKAATKEWAVRTQKDRVVEQTLHCVDCVA